MFTSGQSPTSTGLPESPLFAGRAVTEVFSSGRPLPVALGTQLCPGSHPQPGPPRGSGLVTGQPRSCSPEFPGTPGRALGDYAAVIWD